MIKDDLQKKIQAICTELGIVREVVLEHPQELTHGDFATSIALAASKDLKVNPKELAEKIAQKIRDTQDESIESVSVAGPGFINVTLTKKALYKELQKIINLNDAYGKNEMYEGKKILVEHSSPNLFKPFHIGHLMNNTIGEAMARIIENTSAEVVVISYPSDISLGIAKVIWVIMQRGGEAWVTKFAHTIEGVRNFISEAGPMYVEGTKRYDESEQVQKEVRDIANKLYKKDPNSQEYIIFLVSRELNLRYFNYITRILGSSFSSFIFESETGPIGKKLVLENIPNVFTESEGAIIYEGEKKGLHTRVFINKEGNPTYEAKDIGLLDLKFARYTPDLSIFVTDSEQGPYFKVVSTAAGEINKEWQDKTVHLTHGRMQFKGERMSSRLGGVPTAEEVLDVVKGEAKKKMMERTNGITTATDIDLFSEMIAIAALKFSILKAAPGKNIDFNPDTALSFEGDSGPYVQYTYVRTRALIEKGAAVGITPVFNTQFVGSDLERILYRFEEVTQRAAQEYAPHSIAQYLLEVAQTFNSWYGQEKVIDIENKEISMHRLAIASATGTVLKNALHLLGIQSPERM